MRLAVRIPPAPAMSQCEPPVHFMIAGILNPGALFDPIIPLPRRLRRSARVSPGRSGVAATLAFARAIWGVSFLVAIARSLRELREFQNERSPCELSGALLKCVDAGVVFRA